MRITSPFNKRKIKEINSTKQLMQQQQQTQSQLQHGSSIPTPKKFSVQAQSNLPVFQTNATEATKPKTSSLVSSSESSSSGISNKTGFNSSRSTSPTNISLAESSANGATTSASQIPMNKPNTKLPQFQMASSSTSSISKDKRKISMPKSLKAQPTLQPPQQVQLVQTQNLPSNSKIQQNSKLLAPSSIHLATYANQSISDKTTKRLGSLINQNSTTTTNIASINNTAQSPSQMPVLINTPAQPISINNKLTTQSKKQISTFGLSKLTKLSTNTEPVNAAHTPEPIAKPQVPAHSTPNSTSKIPNTFISAPKSQLKTPSQLKPPTTTSLGKPQNSMTQISQIATKTQMTNVVNLPTSPITPKQTLSAPVKKQTNLPTTPKSKLNQVSMTTFQNNSNIARISPFMSSTNNTKLIAKSSLDDGKTEHDAPSTRQSLKEKSKLNNGLIDEKDEDDDDDDIDIDIDLDDDDENLIDDNDEEFQKFLNSDLNDEVDQLSNQDNTHNLSINTKSNELATNTNKSTLTPSCISPPLPSPPSIVQQQQSKITSPKLGPKNNQQLTTPPLPCLPVASPKNIKKMPSLAPSPNSSASSSTSTSTSSVSCNSNSYLLLTTSSMNTNNVSSVESSNNSNTILNSLNLNSFGRSNTLDRKLKPINQSKNQQQGTKLTSNNNYLQMQHLGLRNSLNIQLKSPNSPSSVYYQPMSVNSKRPLSQEPIMELSNEQQASADQNDLNTKTHMLNNSYLLNSIKISPNTNFPSNGTLSKMQQINYELDSAKSRVMTLTNQLNANSQLVYTLEQTISALTMKLQQFLLHGQKKDAIISDLKAYIEFLQAKYPKLLESEKNQLPRCFYSLNRHNSNDSLNSLNSMFSQRSYQSTATANTSNQAGGEVNQENNSCKMKKQSWLRSSFNKAFSRNKQTIRVNKSEDCNSVYIENTSSISTAPNTPAHSNINNKKLCLSDVEENDLLNKSSPRYSDYNDANGYCGDYSLPSSPMHQNLINNQFKRNSNSMAANAYLINQNQTAEDFEEYQRLLRDKEIKLTDIRLEALATAHQLDQSKEENIKMKIEIEQLKSDNIRMQQILTTFHPTQHSHTHAFLNHQQQHHHQQNTHHLISSPSPSSSVISSSSNNSKMNLSLSNSSHNVDNLIINNQNSSSACSSSSTSSSVSCSLLKSPNGIVLNESSLNDGKRVIVTIYLGDLDNPLDYIVNDDQFCFSGQILIGSIHINTKTKWDILDGMVKRLFNDYLNKLDKNSIESGGLGLGLESINFYLVGDMLRKTNETTEQRIPDLLPYGYLVGNHSNIVIKLKDALQNSIDSLCYDTLVPKNVMQRYISLILDYKNLLFCGPSGTSKSLIARKIAEYLVKRQNKSNFETLISYFDVENKSVKELKQYLNKIQIDEELNPDQSPIVLILDNLHSISNISDAFMDFFSNSKTSCTNRFIIGTLNQSNVTALNLHQNFKWVLCVNHTEPVKNYLTRFLERRLIDQETRQNNQNKSNELEQMIDWIPKLWLNVNKYIEMYNSIDLCIGPKVFSTIPIDFKQALEWFIDIWNQTIVPFMIDAIKEGLEVYGTKISWEDPKIWLSHTLPWLMYDNTVLNRLYSIEAHHVGYENEQLENDTQTKPIEINRRVNISTPNTLNLHSFVSYPNTPCKVLSRNSHENDKLLNMLMKLQEATGLSSSQQQNCFSSIHLDTGTNELIQNVKTLSLISTSQMSPLSLSCHKPVESQL